MKIVDCFLFYNELQLLEFKLKELNDIVDYFVLIESKQTHTGNKKELYYEKNKEMFSEYNHKIVHIIHDHNATAETGDSWSNEKEQRFYGTKGVAQLNLSDDDFIILSDLDEIADKNTLRSIKKYFWREMKPISCLEQDMYYYNINNKLETKWHQSKILNYKTYKEYVDNPRKFNTILRPEYNPDGRHVGHYPIIKNGGWHFSYFGDINFIKNKIKNFAHTELSHFGDETHENINEKIQNNKDIFDREDIKFKNIRLEDNKYLPENYKMIVKFKPSNITNETHMTKLKSKLEEAQKAHKKAAAAAAIATAANIEAKVLAKKAAEAEVEAKTREDDAKNAADALAKAQKAAEDRETMEKKLKLLKEQNRDEINDLITRHASELKMLKQCHYQEEQEQQEHLNNML
tara:strand:+ start:466 stop:1677 length:1212 start_codon:yes stop_codon:yes gene_type:complete